MTSQTAPRPAIKGSALTAVIEDIEKLRESGRIDDELLSARLEDEDIALIGESVQAAIWYPIESYGRMTELLLEVEGGGRPGYLNERGARTARRLIEAGIYQQLERASSENVAQAASLGRDDQIREFRRTIRLVTSLSGSIFNFGRWSVEDDPDHADRFRIVIEDSEAMPEAAIGPIEGFINQIGESSPHVKHLHWTGVRVEPAVIVFTMDAGIDAVYGGAD